VFSSFQHSLNYGFLSILKRLLEENRRRQSSFDLPLPLDTVEDSAAIFVRRYQRSYAARNCNSFYKARHGGSGSRDFMGLWGWVSKAKEQRRERVISFWAPGCGYGRAAAAIWQGPNCLGVHFPFPRVAARRSGQSSSLARGPLAWTSS